jgi:hypothetical protein
MLVLARQRTAAAKGQHTPSSTELHLAAGLDDGYRQLEYDGLAIDTFSEAQLRRPAVKGPYVCWAQRCRHAL